MKFPHKIPTIVAIFLLIVLVIVVSFATNMVVRTTTQASASIEPRNVRITNITSSGFSVTWTTADPATGALIVTAGTTTETYFDQRDSQGKMGKYKTHSISLRDAKPLIRHQIKLLSNGKTFLDNGKPYGITTASILDTQTTPGIEPAFGVAANADESPAAGALVYLTLSGSQVLSTLVGSTGSWLIPLNTIRTENLQERILSKERIEETITIRTDAGETAIVTDSFNDSPVPSVIIGKSYDFRKQQASQPTKSLGTLSLSNEETKDSAVLGETTGKPIKKSYPVTITQPDDTASLISNTPLFSGTGVPGKTVTLTIGIKNPVTTTTTVDKDGLWRYTETRPLGVGRQSVTASTVDNFGKPIAITHIFDVLKSGTQVLGDATASATLTTTPTTAPTETPTPTETATETIEPSPTSTLAGEPPPETGTSLPTILLLMVSAGLLLSGVTLGFR